MRKLITIVGAPNVDPSILDIDDNICLVAEPENAHDLEAVKVVFHGKHVGYVANSIQTVVRGSCSAGNIVDELAQSDGDFRAAVILKITEGSCKRLIAALE